MQKVSEQGYLTKFNFWISYTVGLRDEYGTRASKCAIGNTGRDMSYEEHLNGQRCIKEDYFLRLLSVTRQ